MTRRKDTERAILCGVLNDRERLAAMDPDGPGIPRGAALGAHRLRVRDARAGLVPLNLPAWIGRTPTAADYIRATRCYEALETRGLVERRNLYGGKRTTHLRLTVAGAVLARQLEGAGNDQ